MSTNLETAKKMIDVADKAGIVLGVVSQHRFDDSSQFLKKAIGEGRLGKLLQADAYVKWYRSPEYYSRPIKGSWATEGGGALINQAIHQIDVLLWLAGPVSEVFGYWQLHAMHQIESEDVITSLMRYRTGATGVLQASTAFWPGYTERLELHGTKGTAVISGDKLTGWDVQDDSGEPAPVDRNVASGASDPMAISLTPFERQFLDFGEAIKTGRKPLVSGEEGYRALELVISIYNSCREGRKVSLDA
jgi:predicted dehydrogenase